MELTRSAITARELSDLPSVPEVAVIINVGTKHLSTLALLSTLRYARIPVILIDCESRDGSLEWFRRLAANFEFHLVEAPLRPHGQTLDWLFTHITAKRVLLVDSDVEVLTDEMISKMRELLNGTERAYGSGFLHREEWMNHLYGTVLPLADGIGFYMPRPWIPFALFRTEHVRVALRHPASFMHELVTNDLLPWRRFRWEVFRENRLRWLDPLRRTYLGRKPSYVFYDTGARLHELLTGRHQLDFPSVDAGLVPWSVHHLHGMTRGVVHAGSAPDAGVVTDVLDSVVERLRQGYGVTI